MSKTTDRWLSTLSTDRQQSMLALHDAFWRRENCRILIGYAPINRLFPLQNLHIEHEGRFVPKDITESLMQSDMVYRQPIVSGDDLFPAKIPLEALPWSEGYTGANVYLSSRAKAVWSDHAHSKPCNVTELKNRVDPGWRKKLIQATTITVEAMADERLVSESLFRGPADCIEAVMGAEALCYALYDWPDELSLMAEFMADRVIELYQAQFEVLGTFHGGTINRYRLWGPGQNIVTQADIANVMSPEHFKLVFVPSYRRLMQSFDTVTIHFHSSAAQHVDVLLEIDELDAIEWALDPIGPTLEQMVEVFVKIQRAGKCVIIMNLNTDEQVRLLEDRLDVGGLCLIIRKEF